MVRISLGALGVAVLCLGVLVAQPPGNGEVDQRHKILLAVQVALEQGTELIQKGDFARAVGVLEKQLPYIDGNRRYLTALRDAYRGCVRQLEAAGQEAEAKKMRGFLEILEPTGRAAPAATAKAQPVSKGPVHRGKVEDDDPFAESNRAAKQRNTTLAQAERAYEERNYELASRLFSEAEQAEPGCATACQERWGYCKLYCVAQSMSRGGDRGALGQLEQEVRQALRMAPRLDGFAKGLLERLRDGGQGGEPSVEVKHGPKRESGWATAETPSFRIFHATDEATAEKIARIAESTRVTMTRKWFGEDARPWSPRCDLYVHPTGAAYAKNTGAPPASPGHSSISLEAGRILARRIDLRGDDPNLLIGVVPHETTHVVLAGRFGTHHVPRWADEGMAVLSEPRERIDVHLRNLPMHQREGGLFRLGELMKMPEYPEPRRVGPFYAQSVSLVEFLCRKKDPATFTRFLREGLDGQYEAALQRHYGYRSFAELEREWMGYAFGAEVAAAGE